MRILVVEDDPTLQVFLENHINRWGFELTRCDTCEEAWELFERGDAPHLAAIDWMMPGMSGLELCQRIRQAPLAVRPYLLMLTARTSQADQVKGLEAGFDDYIAKPIELPVLQARLQAGKRQIEQQLALLEHKEEMLDFFDTVDDMVGHLSADGRLTYTNRAWREYLSFGDGAVGSTPLDDIVHPDYRERCRAWLEKCRQGAPDRQNELMLVSQSGETVVVEGQFMLVKEGESTFVRAIFHNITAHKVMTVELRRARTQLEERVAQRTRSLAEANERLKEEMAEREKAEEERLQFERSLLRSERMASIGSVTGGILHNFKGHLQLIMGYGELLKDANPDLDFVEEIAQAAGEMNRMSETILSKSRQYHEAEPVFLNLLLEREVGFLEADKRFRYSVEAQLDLAGDLPPVHCVYTDVSQAFGNLLQNAIDAMEESPAKRLSVSAAVEGDRLAVGITDTGRGIAADDIPRIFDLFYTTKVSPDGSPAGIGLGLYTAHLLLQPYGAEIEVESAVDEGSTFRVRFPLADGD